MQNLIRENNEMVFELWYRECSVAFRIRKILLKNSYYEIQLIDNNPYRQLKPQLTKFKSVNGIK